jgi:hypothetical protein
MMLNCLDELKLNEMLMHDVINLVKSSIALY